MAPAEFVGVLPKTDKRRRPGSDMPSFMLKDSFKMPTIMLFGALAQVGLFALLPARYAVLPPAFLAMNAVVTTIIQTFSSRNAYLDKVVPTKVSAQLPDRDSGRYGSQPAAESMVVLHLGVRYNHPLGVLSPGAKETSEWFLKMNADLTKRADEFGLMTHSVWRGSERASNNTFLLIYYFRNIDGLNKFAHDRIHREAWEWFYKAGHKHIGIFHEAFCSPSKAYESIYNNMHPVLLGAAETKCVDEDTGEEVWVSPLVHAEIGPLRSQFGRMGRAFKEEQERAT